MYLLQINHTTQQLTVDYILNHNSWDEIKTKLNEMAEENRLIKHEVHKTYNTVAGMLGKAKSIALVTDPDDKINIKKQMNPGSKGVRFNLKDHDAKSMITSSQKGKSTKPVSKNEFQDYNWWAKVSQFDLWGKWLTGWYLNWPCILSLIWSRSKLRFFVPKPQFWVRWGRLFGTEWLDDLSI